MAFGDSAATLLARLPGQADEQPRRLAARGGRMSLSYGRNQNGPVIDFTLGGDIKVTIHPDLDDTRRIVGILRGASFWAMEESHNPPPPSLKSAKVEGSVYAQFIVDTLGTVDMTTFRGLKSTHDLFTNAVKQALAGYSFRPGMIAGHKVKTLVQMPFDFSITP